MDTTKSKPCTISNIFNTKQGYVYCAGTSITLETIIGSSADSTVHADRDRCTTATSHFHPHTGSGSSEYTLVPPILPVVQPVRYTCILLPASCFLPKGNVYIPVGYRLYQGDADIL